MADWIHCNKCFEQPRTSKISFYITNCGHVFCGKCVDQGKDHTCHICKTPCNMILLSNNIRDDIRCYFEDPSELLAKYVKIIDFQNNHRLKFQNHIGEEFIKVQKKYILAKEEIRKLQKRIAEIQHDNYMLKMMIKGMQPSPDNSQQSPFLMQKNRVQVTPTYNNNNNKQVLPEYMQGKRCLQSRCSQNPSTQSTSYESCRDMSSPLAGVHRITPGENCSSRSSLIRTMTNSPRICISALSLNSKVSNSSGMSSRYKHK